jgi:hypothetical protein
MRIVRQPDSIAQRLEFFSLGGVLSIWWSPVFVELPWIVAAVSLVLLSFWDVFEGAGRVDFMLIGLAGYELLIGLTEEKDSTDELAAHHFGAQNGSSALTS